MVTEDFLEVEFTATMPATWESCTPALSNLLWQYAVMHGVAIVWLVGKCLVCCYSCFLRYVIVGKSSIASGVIV